MMTLFNELDDISSPVITLFPKTKSFSLYTTIRQSRTCFGRVKRYWTNKWAPCLRCLKVGEHRSLQGIVKCKFEMEVVQKTTSIQTNQNHNTLMKYSFYWMSITFETPSLKNTRNKSVEKVSLYVSVLLSNYMDVHLVLSKMIGATLQ